MHKKRLLKLAELLEADAKNKKGIKFDLGAWGTITDAAAPVSCGTTACAFGLAGISGAFKRDGLDYRLIENSWTGSMEIEVTLNGKCRDGRHYRGTFINARKFFELTDKQTEWLFIATSYYNEPEMDGAKGERIVAKRIRDFVSGTAAP